MINSSQYRSDEVDIREYVAVIGKHWKLICLTAIGLALASFIFSSLQKPVYEAKTSILIRSNTGGSLSQFAGLASLAGLNLSSGGGILPDLLEVLKSSAVAAKVAQDINIRTKVKDWGDPTVSDRQITAAVRKMLKAPKPTSGLVELKVESTDPDLAAEVANAYTVALAYYWNRLNYTEARKKHEYIQSQLPRVEKDLMAAEQKIKGFSLLGIGKPSVELGRLESELDIQKNIYSMLRKENEIVKLEESKEIPPFSVIDPAQRPENRSKPNIGFNTVIGLILGVVFGLFLAFFQEYWEKTQSNLIDQN